MSVSHDHFRPSLRSVRSALFTLAHTTQCFTCKAVAMELLTYSERTARSMQLV